MMFFFPQGLLAFYYKENDSYKHIQMVSDKIPGKFFSNSVKKMFIFGAGGSYNCVLEKDRRIGFPLTKDLLFDSDLQLELTRFSLGLNLLSKRYIPEFNFEIEIAKIENALNCTKFDRKVASDLAVLNIVLRDYFLKKSSQLLSQSNINLYNVLVSQIHSFYLKTNQREDVVMVNFNYDILLDDAIQRVFGFRYKNTLKYISKYCKPFRYYKPHGSANWGLEIKSGSRLTLNTDLKLHERILKLRLTTFEIISRNVLHSKEILYDKGTFASNFNFSNTNSYSQNMASIKVENEWSETNLKYPVLHLPMEDKDTVLLHPIVKYCLESDMQYVEEIFIIGFRLDEKYFENMLKHNLNKIKKVKVIWIVDPKPAPILVRIKNLISIDNIEINFCDSFEEFVLNKLPSILKP